MTRAPRFVLAMVLACLAAFPALAQQDDAAVATATAVLDRMKALSDRLRVIEMEADRLILELHRDIYSGTLDPGEMFLLKEFFEIMEKAIDRCREAGVVAYEIVLKNS